MVKERREEEEEPKKNQKLGGMEKHTTGSTKSNAGTWGDAENFHVGEKRAGKEETNSSSRS